MPDTKPRNGNPENAVKALAAKIQAAYEGDLPTRSFELTDQTEWVEEKLAVLIREERERYEGLLQHVREAWRREGGTLRTLQRREQTPARDRAIDRHWHAAKVLADIVAAVEGRSDG